MRRGRLGYRRTRLERVPCRGSSPSSVSVRVPVATEHASLLRTLRSRGIGEVGVAGKLIRIELCIFGARLTTIRAATVALRLAPLRSVLEADPPAPRLQLS